MGNVTIRDVQVFTTAPEKINLVVIKVLTSEPDLYGLGCATFTQRHLLAAAAVEEYLKPFLIGKDVSMIEDIWQTSMVNSYWRNGPVLNNAVSGIDMALWDIKGKMADMPLYQLFGGKCRDAALAYTHAEGLTVEQTLEEARRLREVGFRNLRLQCGGYGGKQRSFHAPRSVPPGAYFDPKAYVRTTLALFEKARAEFDDSAGLCHDIHERLPAIDAIDFAKKMEAFNLFFLEDPLPPEQGEWLEKLRGLSSVPIALGELFVNSSEWLSLVSRRLIDFIRIHISMVGGISPIRKIAALCEAFGIRTAWHGPGDLSPVGSAVNIHLDISIPNFGIQEWFNGMTERSRAVFPGAPEVHDGYIYISDKPGIGVEFDEKEALKFPAAPEVPAWTVSRLPDGTAVKP
jgi:mannonate dehydratase